MRGGVDWRIATLLFSRWTTAGADGCCG